MAAGPIRAGGAAVGLAVRVWLTGLGMSPRFGRQCVIFGGMTRYTRPEPDVPPGFLGLPAGWMRHNVAVNVAYRRSDAAKCRGDAAWCHIAYKALSRIRNFWYYFAAPRAAGDDG